MIEPATVTLPNRLVALKQWLLERDPIGAFGDWELARTHVHPVADYYPPEERSIVAEAALSLLPIAGDGSGGTLLLDASGGAVESAPVVSFGSEGQIDVLATSFDDFLALLGAEHERDDIGPLEPELAAWVRGSGIVPHASAAARIADLADATRRFRIGWMTRLRESARRQRPGEVGDRLLILGKSVGEFALGMSRAKLDETWGPPTIPRWARSEKGVTVFYANAPVVVHLDPSETRVTGLTLYAGRHRALTSEGIDPMFMPLAEAKEWLASLGLTGHVEGGHLVVPAARARFSLDGVGVPRALQWIRSIEMTSADATR